MSGTDTPEELELDPSDGRGDVVWMMKCEGLLASVDGIGRMRTFVRRFKRKGGPEGGPGDLDELIDELKAIAGEDTEEEMLRGLLEGEDEDAW